MELNRINEGTNTEDIHADQTNQYDILLESSLRLSTEISIFDIHRECVLPFKALAPIDDITPRSDMNPVTKNKQNRQRR